MLALPRFVKVYTCNFVLENTLICALFASKTALIRVVLHYLSHVCLGGFAFAARFFSTSRRTHLTAPAAVRLAHAFCFERAETALRNTGRGKSHCFERARL